MLHFFSTCLQNCIQGRDGNGGGGGTGTGLPGVKGEKGQKVIFPLAYVKTFQVASGLI